MQLSKQNIKKISSQPGLIIPDEKLFALPEKVLQFGTGVLLRGLPDYFIDKANRQGIFNGRIVVVKSTSNGSTDEFGKQDSLYTLCVRGVEDNKKLEETIINSSISRTISANDNWQTILECAYNPELQIIISNTTEVGIALVEDDIRLFPPHSFPGKLLAFLHERYKAFKGSDESGMVIIPTELITDNGAKLFSILLELAKMNKLDDRFANWLKNSNHFCNSLVDRIVPGKLTGKDKTETERKLGYKDDLVIMAECFRLWAIESGSEKVKEILSFSRVDDAVVISPDIEVFRELKLRLLNGTHSFSCGLAFLAGFGTVRNAMADETMSSFVRNLMIREIAEAMSGKLIPYPDACNFAGKVMDRFRNPYLDHQWSSITVQYSSKMKLRNVPLLLKHYSKTSQPPEHMALGFAGYLLFMKCTANTKGQYVGNANGTEYMIQDDHAAYFADKWQKLDADCLVDAVLTDKNFWGEDLGKLNARPDDPVGRGFAGLVKNNLRSLMSCGVMATIRSAELNKTTVS
jgi:tagaturonate reductase